MTYEKIKESVDRHTDPNIEYNDAYELYAFMLYLAEKIRPEHLIGACPAGDATYVWKAILANAYQDFIDGRPAVEVDDRTKKIERIAEGLRSIKKEKNLDKIDDYIGKYVVKEYEEWIASTKKMDT